MAVQEEGRLWVDRWPADSGVDHEGQGYGRKVLQGVQKAAQQVRCPVATVVWANNPHARQHYLALGFQVEERNPAAERLVWYPQG